MRETMQMLRRRRREVATPCGPLGMMALGLALGLTGALWAADDFEPTRSVVIDAGWVGKKGGLPLEVSNGRLTLRLGKMRIPKDVAVRFRGFSAVRLQAENSVEVLGALVVEAGDGENGEAARGGQAGRGGSGGSGYGAGLAGQGGSPNGWEGAVGEGSIGPGHPERRSDPSCRDEATEPAGGAAGGSNGTAGGRGAGCWRGGSRYWEGDRLGRDDAFDPGVAPGGGSGGGGGARRGEWAGGGGGGGGSSGGLEIRSADSIRISGRVRLNGGAGGIGGDGARRRAGEACGGEGNDCGGGGGGGAGGAGGYIVLQAGGEIQIARERDFDLREALQADGGIGGTGGEGSPTGVAGPPGGGGRIRLIARGGVYQVVGRTRTPITAQAGRPACWVQGQPPNCALSAQPGLASISVSTRTASAGSKEYIYVNGHPVAKVEH